MGFTRKPAEFYFKEKHQAKNIGKKSIQGYIFTTGTNGIKFFINIATVSILARLLLPEDFGYVAMAATFISTPKMITGQYSTGLIQSFSIEPDQLNGFYWLCTGATLIIALLSFMAAPLVTWFFETPLLTNIIIVMILMILFTGLSGPHHALLTRTMQFGLLSVIDLSARIASKLTAISLAFWGAGYWALVAMPVSYEGVRMVLLWFFCRFRPGIGRIPASSKSLFKLGSALSGTAILTSIVSEVDRILIGKFWNGHVLGIYSRAYNLGELPGKFLAWPLGSIAVSALSRLQEDHEKCRRFFLIMTEGYFLLIVPIMITIFVSCQDIVLLLLGNNWRGSIPILKTLSLFFLFKHLSRPATWFLISTYESASTLNKIVKLSIYSNLFLVLGIIAGTKWGGEGIAFGLVVASSCFLIFTSVYAFSKTFISTGAFWQILWRILVSCVLTLVLNHLLVNYFGISIPSHFFSIIFTGILVCVLFYFIFCCLPGGRSALKNIIDMAWVTIRKKTES